MVSSSLTASRAGVDVLILVASSSVLLALRSRARRQVPITRDEVEAAVAARSDLVATPRGDELAARAVTPPEGLA